MMYIALDYADQVLLKLCSNFVQCEQSMNHIKERQTYRHNAKYRTRYGHYQTSSAAKVTRMETADSNTKKAVGCRKQALYIQHCQVVAGIVNVLVCDMVSPFVAVSCNIRICFLVVDTQSGFHVPTNTMCGLWTMWEVTKFASAYVTHHIATNDTELSKTKVFVTDMKK